MQVSIRLNDALYMTDITMNGKGIDAETEWEKVEAFLERINGQRSGVCSAQN